MASMKVTLPDGIKLCCGKQITFRAPCSCVNIDSLIIGEDQYTLTDSMNGSVSNAFAANSLVSVLIDPENHKAYLLNYVTRASHERIDLLAGNWSTDGTYSLEDLYPYKYYDIEVSVDSSATIEQIEAFSAACICGSHYTNIITAKGDVPDRDIPIIVKVVNR